MIISGQCSPAGRIALVTAALMRIGSDTRGPRLFKDLVAPGLRAWTDAERVPRLLAEALGWSTAEAAERIGAAAERAARAEAAAAAAGLALVTLADAAYPALLREIHDPPLVLWTRGDLRAVNDRPGVALVGSRRAGPSSLETARRLARDLAKAGLTVVSGLARGVDAAAHRGALEGGGTTAAVLGNGADVVYPAEHRALASAVAESGLIVSELPPGTPPLAHHFPLRNRLISGLSRAVVVVEASERSGSLITARLALEQGREVLAVPGSVTAGCHSGCHALIKDGARLVENVKDVLEEVGWTPRPDSGADMASKPIDDNGLLGHVKPGELVTADDLVARTGRGTSQILGELSRLEIEGLIRRTGLGTFARVD